MTSYLKKLYRLDPAAAKAFKRHSRWEQALIAQQMHIKLPVTVPAARSGTAGFQIKPKASNKVGG